MTVCHLCGAPLAAAPCIIEVGRFEEPCRSVACSECGLVQQDPMPSEEELDAYYRETYRQVHLPMVMEVGDRTFQPPHLGGSVPAYEHAHALRATQKVHEHQPLRPAILESLGARKGHRLLEIGAGPGRIAAEVMTAGVQVVAVEPDDECRATALDLGVDCRASLEGVEGPFDGAYMVHSLEHMREPIAVLRAVRRMLKPRRRIYIEVPNLAMPYGTLAWFFQGPHLYNFAPNTLSAILHCAGFDRADKMVAGGALWAIGESVGEDRDFATHPPLVVGRGGDWWAGYLWAYHYLVASRAGG